MELGSSPLDVDQATTIWTRLDKAYNGIRRIPKSHLIHFGYIWTGISDIVLKNLQLNPEEAADVIASFTSFDRSFTRSQVLIFKIINKTSSMYTEIKRVMHLD